MATIDGANTGTLANTIQSESISGLVLPAPNRIRVYQAFTWQCPGSGKKLVIPQFASSPITGTKTETDAFAATDLETVGEEVTPAMVGRYVFHSEELDLEGSILTMQARVDATVEELENRIDKDVLGMLVSAAGSDFSGTNLSVTNFEIALAAFQNANPTHQRICFVGSTNQIRDLRRSIRESGGGNLIAGAGLALNGLPVSGYCGTWQGVEIYQGNVTQADATNDCGGFVAAPPLAGMAPGASLGIMPGAGLIAAVWRGIKIGMKDEPVNTGTAAVVSSYYGVGISADNNVWSFISKKAAAA